MRTRTVATVVALTSLLLTGCSAIHAGTITDKIYSETYTTQRSQCVMYNGKGGCSMYQWVTDHHPETFRFDIEDGEDTGWVYVDKYEYESHEVGDWYEGD